jgi:hypothetical protein
MFRVSLVVLVPIEALLCRSEVGGFCSANGLVEQERFAHVFDFRNCAAQVEGF